VAIGYAVERGRNFAQERGYVLLEGGN